MRISTLATVALAAPALAAVVPAPAPSINRRSTIAEGLVFVPQTDSPTSQSPSGGGLNNGTLSNPPVVPGKVFDRIIQIWLENTNADVALSTPAFMDLAKQGIALNASYSVTHPSEPSYIASVVGDFFGLADDSFNHIPTNITSVFDLLDEKAISWACYQENMPTTGFTGFNYTSKAYINGSNTWTYYVRKHNPCAILDRVSGNATLRQRNRNFNDFAADVNANALPQWSFFTPNMVNDGHDTSPAFLSNWTNFWLKPLLTNPNFSTPRTLVVLSFDESETNTDENRVATVLLGGAIPPEDAGSTDPTFYTHYSFLSTVQANWGLKSLGRGDANRTLANVLDFVARKVNYSNVEVPAGERPPLNLTGVAPGPLSATRFVEFYAPPFLNATGAGGRGVLVLPGLNTSQVLSADTPTVNLTAMGAQRPYATDPFAPPASTSGSTGGAAAQVRGLATSSSLLMAGLALVGGAVATLL